MKRFTATIIIYLNAQKISPAVPEKGQILYPKGNRGGVK
jgi:hypothetical protein